MAGAGDSRKSARVADAVQLMLAFVERTGVTPGARPRRYLWTDAFAVCNLLGLARVTARKDLEELAVHLVDQVHHVLGRHRDDDPRRGWISGLADEEGEEHPTRGGLRIGKELPERGPDEPIDPDAEWDRDGQYFHYLTRWMHALAQLSRATGDPTGRRWARELAVAAHAAFVIRPGAPRRMIWKASVDLRRPLVSSMGHHDPLDGLVTCLSLAAGDDAPAAGPDLAAVIADLDALDAGRDLVTDDPLGLGGLLTDAHLLDQLARAGLVDPGHVPPILAAAAEGLEQHLATRPLGRSASRRLAFRELGLAIGMHAVERMVDADRRHPGHLDPAARVDLGRLAGHVEVARAIESFWLEHRGSPSFLAHEDIDAVMLATSLAPDGYLSLGLG